MSVLVIRTPQTEAGDRRNATDRGDDAVAINNTVTLVVTLISIKTLHSHKTTTFCVLTAATILDFEIISKFKS